MAKALVDNALDISNMPEGKDWMSIAPCIVTYLHKEELVAILQNMVGGGQLASHDFYNALEQELPTSKVLKLIEIAKAVK